MYMYASLLPTSPQGLFGCVRVDTHEGLEHRRAHLVHAALPSKLPLLFYEQIHIDSVAVTP